MRYDWPLVSFFSSSEWFIVERVMRCGGMGCLFSSTSAVDTGFDLFGFVLDDFEGMSNEI